MSNITSTSLGELRANVKEEIRNARLEKLEKIALFTVGRVSHLLLQSDPDIRTSGTVSSIYNAVIDYRDHKALRPFFTLNGPVSPSDLDDLLERASLALTEIGNWLSEKESLPLKGEHDRSSHR